MMASDDTKSLTARNASSFSIPIDRKSTSTNVQIGNIPFTVSAQTAAASTSTHLCWAIHHSVPHRRGMIQSPISSNLPKITFYYCNTSSHDNVQGPGGIFLPEPKFITFSGIVEDSRYKYELSMDCNGLLSRHSSPNVTLPRQYQPPAPNNLSINTLELELMLFLQDNLVPSQISVCQNHEVGLQGLPSWLSIRFSQGKDSEATLDTCFPPSLHGGRLLSKQFSAKELYLDDPMKLWYYDPIELMAAALRNPLLMKHFVCTPQTKRTSCGNRIYNKITSAEWFHNAFRSSPASDNEGNLIPGRLFVALADFDNKSATNKLMKVTGHPFLMTFLNLTLEGRKRSDNWLLISLLPNIDVSDTEKIQNLILDPTKKTYPFSVLISTISAPNFFTRPLPTQRSYKMWVHGMGWTDVFFQTGLVIGNTEQQNKICGFREAMASNAAIYHVIVTAAHTKQIRPAFLVIPDLVSWPPVYWWKVELLVYLKIIPDIQWKTSMPNSRNPHCLVLETPTMILEFPIWFWP